MTLAVMALYADGTTTLRNIASWRVKETDRIAAMTKELRKLGADVEEGADYIRITPPASTADRKSTRLNSSHLVISYAVFCLKKKNDRGGGLPIAVLLYGKMSYADGTRVLRPRA